MLDKWCVLRKQKDFGNKKALNKAQRWIFIRNLGKALGL